VTRRRILIAALFITASLTALLTPIGVGSAAALDDTHGRDWRQLYETTGLSWEQVAQVCPRDGVTPCNGTVGGKVLTGWVWATSSQVLELMTEYAPDLAAADPPQLSGSEAFGAGVSFLSAMRWTTYHVTNYSYSEWTGGWTSSTDAAGAPIGGGAGYGWHPITGSIGIGAGGSPTEMSPYRGVFLWRTAGLDYSPPVITPTIAGTLGSNGWFVSDLAVSWTVTDAESPIDSQTGCDPSGVTVDTTATGFTCEATSAGGTSSASTVVKRDTVAPAVACEAPAPVFELGTPGAVVAGSVSDATSGPLASSVTGVANTANAGSFTAAVVGTDLAGTSTTRQCPYRVVVPLCRGLTPTIVGTAGTDVIKGTAKRDVIHGLTGNDTITAVGGNDIVCGGAGDDEINGGAGADVLDGGAGYDSIRGEAGKDTCTSGEKRMSSCEIIQ
jgi:hypothetical protein